ncbi:hypothetical protein HDU82_005022 [Entophlyctis luteolus]|nr:hypothetical protein HDU82_005022 [Entophlyctis luteolus]
MVSTYDKEAAKASRFEPVKNNVPLKSKATSLYQDTYENPRMDSEELKLLDNKSNRTGNYHPEIPAQHNVSTLLHMVKEPAFATSYVHDFVTEQPIVEAKMGPSFASNNHPLQTRQIVKKAFKYRRY